MLYDLHSHTTCSDGSLTPQELVARASEQGVDVLAITDHDTVEAFRNLPPQSAAIRLIRGIEFSTQWQSTGIHVLGLDIDLASASIRAGVGFQTRARRERAARTR